MFVLTVGVKSRIRHGFTNTVGLMVDLVERRCRIVPIVGENLGPRVEVNLLRHRRRLIQMLFLVNHTGCDGLTIHPAPVLRDLTLQLPAGITPHKATALRLGREIPVHRQNGVCVLELSRLGLHEAIRLEMHDLR